MLIVKIRNLRNIVIYFVCYNSMQYNRIDCGILFPLNFVKQREYNLFDCAEKQNYGTWYQVNGKPPSN